MSSPIDHQVQVHGGLATYTFGAGEPIFLMPGPHRLQRPGLRSADALISGLVTIGRRVITYDPPGSGRSTRPAYLSMAEMHACADEALDVAGAGRRVDCIGHSMGGLAMLAYALARPERLRRLVLVGTGSGGPAYTKASGAIHRRGHPEFWKLAVAGSLHTLWPCRASERLTLNLIERASFVDRRWSRPRRVSWRDWLRPREGRTDWHWIARKLDYAARLGDISAPTLILVGRHDPQFPMTCSEELHANIPRSRLVCFERSGHYPFIEEAQSFWSTVAGFLAAAPKPVSVRAEARELVAAR